MTDVPLPPPQDPGAYPPLPPGAYPPPPGAYPPPPGPGGPLPGGTFEIWIRRVGAWIIDLIPYGILVGIGQGIAASTATDSGCNGVTYGDPMSGGGVSYATCGVEYSGVGIAAIFLFWVAGIAWLVWNNGYRQGTTGSSIGKNLLGIKVVGEQTGQPIGFGMSVVRQIAHILDGLICGIGYLLPLFTPKRQTIADMLVKTVVIPK